MSTPTTSDSGSLSRQPDIPPAGRRGFRVELRNGVVIVCASRAVAVQQVWRFLTPARKTVLEIPTRDVVAITSAENPEC